MKPFSLLLLVVGSFACGVVVRDQADDERLQACEQNEERAVQFSTVISKCLSGYAITDGQFLFRCKVVRS